MLHSHRRRMRIPVPPRPPGRHFCLCFFNFRCSSRETVAPHWQTLSIGARGFPAANRLQLACLWGRPSLGSQTWRSCGGPCSLRARLRPQRLPLLISRSDHIEPLSATAVHGIVLTFPLLSLQLSLSRTPPLPSVLWSVPAGHCPVLTVRATSSRRH